MLGFLAYKSKFKSDNYISMQMLTTNNEGFQLMRAKNASSNNGAIYILDNCEFFSLVTFIKHLHSCKTKRINKNKDNNKFISPVTLI